MNNQAHFLANSLRRVTFGILGITLLLGTLLNGSSTAQESLSLDKVKLKKKYQQSRQYLMDAKKYYLNDQLTKAQRTFQKCVKIMPEQHEAHYYLSQIYYKYGELLNALQYINKAETTFPIMDQIVDTINQELRSQLLTKKDALVEKRNDLEDHYWRTDDAQRRNKIKDAKINVELQINDIDREINDLVPGKSSIPASYDFVHGNIVLKMNKPEQALQKYHEAIKKDPNFRDAYNNLISTYFMQKQYQQAQQYLTEAEKKSLVINPELKNAIQQALKEQQ